LERRLASDPARRLTHREALEVFTALWRLALKMRPDFPEAWQNDIAPDLELARVLNALHDDA
jgi:hypothetical protein